MQQTRSAQTQQQKGRPQGRPFCFNGIVAKDYQIDETEEALMLHVPPPNVAWKVVVSTILASSTLWFAALSFYDSLAYSESNWSWLYWIAVDACGLICVLSARALYRQLAKKKITFERHTIGIDYSILGIRLRRRWFSVHQVQEWITVPLRNERRILLAMRYNDRTVRLVETLDTDLWLSLVIRMQRKNFAFV